jgi:hypothetical protein
VVILQQRARHTDTVAQIEHTVGAGTVLVGIYQDHPPATLRGQERRLLIAMSIIFERELAGN